MVFHWSLTDRKSPQVNLMFHSFFNSLARWRYLSFFSHSFRFIPWSAGTAKSTIFQIHFIIIIIIIIIIYSLEFFTSELADGLMVWWSLSDSKSP